MCVDGIALLGSITINQWDLTISIPKAFLLQWQQVGMMYPNMSFLLPFVTAFSALAAFSA